MPTKWQYHREPIAEPQDAETQLNKLGEDGWELVQIIDHDYYLKREKVVLDKPRLPKPVSAS